jgi:hypothetical protein
MQWQHGSFSKQTNGSLVTVPIAVDGRQLYSDPCAYKNSIYTRYNATETFKVRSLLPPSNSCTLRSSSDKGTMLTPSFKQRYEVLIDGYTQKTRLNLYKFDGSPLLPLYLAYSPPNMLPTSTLNPLTTSTAAAAKATSKVKRAVKMENLLEKRTLGQTRADNVWWFGVFLTASGGFLYLVF